MTLDATIDANLPEVVRYFDDLRRSQVPFATALGLTQTAADAQAEVRRQLPKRFVLRRPWVSQGIRTTRATKARLQADVYSRDAFMALQEEGGRKPRRGRSTALPRAIRTSARTVIPRARRPKRILESRPRTFVAPIQGGPDRGIFQRRGKRQYPIKLLYRLERGSIHVDPRFGFNYTVAKVVRDRFDANFGRALARALATAGPR